MLGGAVRRRAPWLAVLVGLGVTASTVVGAAAGAGPGPVGTGAATFTDVPDDHPFVDDVEWLAVTGITTGYADGGFHPAAVVTRQAVAAFLQRFADHLALPSTTPGTVPTFGDVPADHPFAEPIEWMAANGFADGFPDGDYHPTDPVSRQALASFLHRLLGAPTVLPVEPSFTDVPADHPFAEPIEWLAAAGLAGGYPDGGFHPAAPITRQALAALLHRAAVSASVGTKDVLPFALTYESTGDAGAACLLPPPPGLDPAALCPGPHDGSLGVLDLVRPVDLGVPDGCDVTTAADRLARNLALGLDHPVDVRDDWTRDDVLGAGDEPAVPDGYPLPLAPSVVNVLHAGELLGAKAPTQVGLLDGGAFGPGRLTVVPDAAAVGRVWETTVFDPKGNGGWDIDDMGLWEFIGTAGETFGGDWVQWEQVVQGAPGTSDKDDDSNGTPDYYWDLSFGSMPGLCDPTVDPYVEPHRDDDGDGDPTDHADDDATPGVEDERRTWWWSRDRMLHCLYAIHQSSSDTTVFDRDSDGDGVYDLEHSPRFGYLPEAWDDLAAPCVAPCTWSIRRFRPAYVDQVFFVQGGSNVCASFAGEGRVAVLGVCPRNAMTLRSAGALLFDVDDRNTGAAEMLPEGLQRPDGT